MLSGERLEQIKKDGRLMGGNIGSRAFKELVDEIHRLREVEDELRDRLRDT